MNLTLEEHLKKEHMTLLDLSFDTGISENELKNRLHQPLNLEEPANAIIVRALSSVWRNRTTHIPETSSAARNVALAALFHGESGLIVAVGNTLGFKQLALTIEQGTASDFEIADLLADISILNRMMGGSGLAYHAVDTAIVAKNAVTASVTAVRYKTKSLRADE